jgi:phage terminase small subunit
VVPTGIEPVGAYLERLWQVPFAREIFRSTQYSSQTRGLRGAGAALPNVADLHHRDPASPRPGITVTNPETGCARKNPALSAAETAGAQLLASCREFGLTPSSEQRLAAAPADDGGDPFAG